MAEPSLVYISAAGVAYLFEFQVQVPERGKPPYVRLDFSQNDNAKILPMGEILDFFAPILGKLGVVEGDVNPRGHPEKEKRQMVGVFRALDAYRQK